MSEAAVLPIVEEVAGRSLWVDARMRLTRNRAAVASMAVLALIALACLFGPLATGHPYDRVYQDYVRVPASLSPHPQSEQIVPGAERIAARIRARAEDVRIEGNALRLTLVAPRPIDERLLAFFDRSDLFGPAQVLDRADDGRRLSIEAPLERRRFLFGTDANGRDLLTRTLVAGRVSLAIGLLATAVAIVIGVIYGAVAGYLGGRVDLVMMRFVDILYSLPFMFFVIILMVVFGRNIILLFVALGAVEWLTMARIVRGQTLSVKRKEFIEAAHAAGVSNWRIVLRHIIPNVLGPVVVYVTLTVPEVIMTESFLSFLGLGVQEPYTSWGVLISEGAGQMESAPWMLIYPASFLAVTLFCFNFIGDGLRDALDPKDR